MSLPSQTPARRPVDVIVPVHGGGEVVAACLESVLAHTDLSLHRLVVVVDGDPAFLASPICERLRTEGTERVLIIELPQNQGFITAVNTGMALSERDVVLLNSDTAVTARWVEKLQDAALSAPEIATVTPFSNDATLCSLPRPFVANLLPAGWDLERFAALVERVSERCYPPIPTGVGMCLYVRRQAIERLGLFDQQVFGAGYGEETDFCFRAVEAGFIHVLDDATFIFHHGQRSFGRERERRVRHAEKMLRRRHPGYVATIARFMREDPLRAVRERVLRGLVPSRRRSELPPRRVVHLVHGWPPWDHGGTELYAAWLARHQGEEREVAVYARIAEPSRGDGEIFERLEGPLRVRLVVNNFRARNPLVRNAMRNPGMERDFARFLAEVEPELVHVHHLAGHAASLAAVAAAREVPIVYQIQDWWPLCARVNLWRPEGELCSGPAPAKCAACLPLTRVPPAGFWSALLYRYRSLVMRRALGCADAFVCGSRFIAASYRELGLLRKNTPVHVVPYGVDLPPWAPRRKPTLPLRFGYLGALMPHKGVHVAVEAFAEIDPEKAMLDIWGSAGGAPEYARQLETLAPAAAVKFHGPFPESEKDAIFAAIDALIVPSLGLESFGIVAREALARGVPVLASRRGALEELFAEIGDPFATGRGGAWFEPGSVNGLRALIRRLTHEPEILAGWAPDRPPVVGWEEHAEAIEKVYAEVLAARSRGRR